MTQKTKTVFVGLSGGVDSSVAAALLLSEGYHVVGAYMKNWTRDIVGNECPWEDDLRSAKSVAAHLGIELKVFDLQKQYRERVVDAMVSAYSAGLTPNPDVLCNQEIKFSLFYDLCREAGADFVATGHYARLLPLALTPSASPAMNVTLATTELVRFLTTAVDHKKDQTYFLYRMPVASAGHVLFPLGEYQKTQVREMARKYGLPTASRPDSMGLCFVGKIALKDFLSEFISLESGDILDENGTVIGQHDGAELYTVGQRHGLGVGGGRPYYVLSKDLSKNTVTVTTQPEKLKREYYDIAEVIWWSEPKVNKNYKVRIRHLGELLDCQLRQLTSEQWRVDLTNGAHRGVAAGQHAVIYDGDTVLGGGIIQ